MPYKSKSDLVTANARRYLERKAKYSKLGLNTRGQPWKRRQNARLDLMDLQALKDPTIREGRI